MRTTGEKFHTCQLITHGSFLQIRIFIFLCVFKALKDQDSPEKSLAFTHAQP